MVDFSEVEEERRRDSAERLVKDMGSAAAIAWTEQKIEAQTKDSEREYWRGVLRYIRGHKELRNEAGE